VAGVSRTSRLLIAAVVGGIVAAMCALTAALVVSGIGRADPVSEPDWPNSVVDVQTYSSRDWLELDRLTVVHVDVELSRWDTNAIVAALDYALVKEDPHLEAGSVVLTIVQPDQAPARVDLALPLSDQELSAALDAAGST
jgi:hypothetical protein